MEARVHRAAVSTAGFLFAAVGFSLSVLAVFFALLIPTFFTDRAKPPASAVGTLEKRRARHVSKIVRPSSEIASTSSLALSTPKQTEIVPNVALIANHEHITSSPSPSPPPIRRTERNLSHSLKRKPPTITFVQDPHTTTLPTSSSRTANATSPERILIPSEFEEGRSGFKFSNLKPLWGEKRPKQQLFHASSSPHLTSKPPLPVVAQGEPRRHLPLGKKRSEPFGPENDTSTTRSVSCPTMVPGENKRVEKKKSQTLRTQPYEAPYFFPPPVPPVPNVGDAVKRRNPSRSRTLPPRHRSASPPSSTEQPKMPKVRDGTLGPPSVGHK